jgi:serine/threonine protein kinase
MHSLDVVHGDLKAVRKTHCMIMQPNLIINDHMFQVNVLISEDRRACLTDFGLATLAYYTASFTGTSSVRGTLRWMAPELLSAESPDADAGRPSVSADVYALAMVIWEVSANVPVLVYP